VNITADASLDAVLTGLDLLTENDRHPHINFWIDDNAELADALSQQLAERGLARENNELLLFSSQLQQVERPTTLVEIVAGSVLDPVVRQGWVHDLPDVSDDVISQLVDRRTAYEAAVDTSYLVVRVDGEPVSRATLYRAGHVGQVEDVNTIDAYRGRGYAGACVTRGVEILQEEGCDLIFLESDADDWPRELYFRLGFTRLAPLPIFSGPE
jgi:ribosomal protein S18 acetylase RimI-like enzyme